MNVVPFYGTKIEEILTKDYNNQKILDNNCRIIHEKSKNVSKVFVAWGWVYPKKKLPKETKEKILNYFEESLSYVKKNLRNNNKLYCYCINESNKQPRHPLQWSNDKREEDFDLFENYSN